MPLASTGVVEIGYFQAVAGLIPVLLLPLLAQAAGVLPGWGLGTRMVAVMYLSGLSLITAEAVCLLVLATGEGDKTNAAIVAQALGLGTTLLMLLPLARLIGEAMAEGWGRAAKIEATFLGACAAYPVLIGSLPMALIWLR